MTWVCSDCPRGGHVIRLCSPVHSVDRLVSHLSVTTETAIVVVVVAGVPRVELDQCTHLEHTPFPDTSRLPGVNCNEQRNRRHIHRLHRRFFFFFEKGGGYFEKLTCYEQNKDWCRKKSLEIRHPWLCPLFGQYHRAIEGFIYPTDTWSGETGVGSDGKASNVDRSGLSDWLDIDHKHR